MWRTRPKYRFWAIGLLLAAIVAIAAPMVFAGEDAPVRVAQGAISQGALQVKYPVRVDKSAPLRTMKPAALAPESKEAREVLRTIQRLPLPKAVNAAGKSAPTDPNVVQTLGASVGLTIPTPVASFDGIYNTFGVLPPDTNGDIGVDPTTGTKYYFQTVNVGFAIWDVTDPANPTQVQAPTANNTIWSGFGGICETHNDGDPIVLFDHLANRWLFSQFALGFPDDFHQCIAISATADPTGSWYRYDYQVSTSKLNDYPHFGVWRDAYYMSANQFDGASLNWAGAGVWAFERDAMLQGLSARMVYFDIGAVTLDYGGMLPADLDGPAPPAGTPGYFIEWDDSTWLGDSADTLRIWEFVVDWSNPSNSTFGANANFDPNYMVPTADVDPDMCNFDRNCIPQPGGTPVDAISDRLMYRLAFRVWGPNDFSMVSNHTVDVDANDHAGIHWFEIGWDGTTWSIFQEGVYAPDGDHRWMGSIAMDQARDIALGFSVSSASTYPSVRYAGRLAGDPLGDLTQGEETFVTGGGSQGHSSGRWGDYSMMGVDPTDDCTFWYTQEYYASDSEANWSTRIGAFRFPSCTAADTGTITGQVTDASTSNPIPNARVEIVDIGYVTYTDSSGTYTFASVPVGTYDMSVTAFGYDPASATGVTVTTGSTTTQDFALNPLPTYQVTFQVYDSITGWPLYAKIEIDGVPFSPIYTDPETGEVVAELPEGTYTAHATAMSGGYAVLDDTTTVTSALTWQFPLAADLVECNAPGYAWTGFEEDFEGGVPPTDWSVVDNIPGGGLVWDTNMAYGDDNYTGGTGLAADVNSDRNKYAPYDTELITPVLDPATLPTLTLIYKANFQSFSGNEALDLDVSTDNGATWNNILHWTDDHGSLYSTPGETVTVDLTPYVGTSPFQLRWRYYTSESAPWDWYAQIDDVTIAACQPVGDGLVYGSVYDLNTTDMLPTFVVTDTATGTESVFVDARDDAATPDYLYILAAAAGDQTLTASTTLRGYGTDTKTVTVIAGAAVEQDFALPAGLLSVSPTTLDFTLLQLAEQKTQTITIENTGGLDANFAIYALNGTPPTLAPIGFAAPRRLVGRQDLNAMSATDWRGDLITGVPQYISAAGDVLSSWAPGLGYAWGLGYDKDASSGPIWISDLGVAGGDDKDHQFETDGTPTGNTMDVSSWIGVWAADMAYDPFHKTLWQVNVGGDNCIYEMDPVSLAPTGEKICPSWSVSQRGLAYDPQSDTFFAGGWNEGIIYRFNRSGTIIESKSVGLPIASLAYNSSTGHLFVLINADTSSDSVYDVYVLDVNDNYNVIGGFDVMEAGMPVFGAAGGQAGMGIDCNGHLWIVNQSSSPQKVYEVDSGETGVCDWRADWISVDVDSGSVVTGGNITINVTVDAYALRYYGDYTGYLRIVNDTPYGPKFVTINASVQGYVPLRGDFNGDGKMDLAVFRPSENKWYIQGQSPVLYGDVGDIPVPADYDGDGDDDVAVFRSSDHTWRVYGLLAPFVYADPGDVPVTADYDGDGVDEIAVYRPSNASFGGHSTWHVYGFMGPFVYGDPGDVPAPADYNGDGKADIAIFRPSTGQWYIYGVMGGFTYGQEGDLPVPADYNGDGKAEVAVFRPSTGEWFIRGASGGFVYGQEGDIPVPGDYNGDGKAEIAVFRPSTGTWYINGMGAYVFGQDGDIPAAPIFDPSMTP